MEPNPLPLTCPFEKIFPSRLVQDDESFMKLAYNRAIDAYRLGEVPVGAIIARQGEIIGSAHNLVDSQAEPTAHAEMLAITQAASHIGDWRLNECTLYVTKEPCPMCSGAVIMARLGRVVFGVGDPKMGCLGGAAAIHYIPTLNHHPEVVSGVLAEECHALLRAFFQAKRREQ